MRINIDTKYNVGDKVYVLYTDFINNDYYCTETAWYILRDTKKYNRPPIVSHEIEAIKIAQYEKSYEIKYLINNCYYSEKNLFLTQKKAETECEFRNNYNY